MAERDAFGNIIGEDDPLKDMGWSVGGERTAASDPVPSAPTAPPTAPAMSATPQSPRQFTQPAMPSAPPRLPNIPGGGGPNVGRIVGRFVALAVFLAIGGAIAAAVIGGVDKVKDVTDSFTVPSFSVPSVSVPTPSVPTAESPSTPSKPAKAPVGLQRGSMIRAEAFGKALVRLRQEGGRAQTLRLDAERVSANLLTKANALRIVSLTWDGNAQVVKTSSHLSGQQTVSLAGVSSQSAERAVKRAAAMLGRGASKVNYLVLTNFAGTSQWFIYFKDGKYLKASLDGRNVQRIN